jgi:hydroxymethylbilane synthase
VSAERALLARLQGGCQVPLGALAELRGDTLQLAAAVCALDGSRELRARGSRAAAPGSALEVREAVTLGERIADELIAAGAAELIARQREALAVAAP